MDKLDPKCALNQIWLYKTAHKFKSKTNRIYNIFPYFNKIFKCCLKTLVYRIKWYKWINYKNKIIKKIKDKTMNLTINKIKDQCKDKYLDQPKLMGKIKE